ncbi:uncharacterized protein LOC121857663 [Homarus americanus]|uniref:Putative KIX domain-containing protein n=1 Tax=Homarus americanus TaxID=6706 RepID=A0A8J5J5F3_HOMAM|nr:uncharacterized protein LOC121857663 [Homarus americanus]KAG7153301.1 putative KIX domain-containing protein [Homarus americanus]
MQLRRVDTPRVGDLPSTSGDLPLGTSSGHRDCHNCNLDRSRESGHKGKILRHRCPFRHCTHRHTYLTCSTLHEEDCVKSGSRTRRSEPFHQTHLEDNRHYNITNSPAERPLTYPSSSPAYFEHVALNSQRLTTSQSPTPPIQNYRQRIVQYIIQQLQVSESRDVHKVQEIRSRIVSLEQQVYHSVRSQEEYVTKLASKLGAILQQLDRCRPSTPVLAAHSCV